MSPLQQIHMELMVDQAENRNIPYTNNFFALTFEFEGSFLMNKKITSRFLTTCLSILFLVKSDEIE